MHFSFCPDHYLLTSINLRATFSLESPYYHIIISMISFSFFFSFRFRFNKICINFEKVSFLLLIKVE